MHGTCAISYKTQKINQIFISEKFQEEKSPDSAPFPASQPVSQPTTDKFCEPRAAGSWNNFHKTYQVCDLIKNIVNIHAFFLRAALSGQNPLAMYQNTPEPAWRLAGIM